MTGDVRFSWRRWLAAAHDGISIAGFYCAVVCLAVIMGAYIYEVAARYFFSAPSWWVSSVVSYMLIYIVFLAMPELTRQRVHIFISVFLDVMHPARATMVMRTIYVIAGLACIMGAIFSLDASYKQYVRGISTVTEWRVPKWLVSAAIPYGLFFAGLHYLRHAASGARYHSGKVD